MNRVYLVALISIFTLSVAGQELRAQGKRPADYVRPMVGTKSMGHTFPGACAPFGAVQLSPDTEMIPHNIDGVYQPDAYRYCAGYQYDDKTIVGFSHTHLNGTGHSDLGDILIMATTGEVKLDMGSAEVKGSGYRSSFSHNTEQAYPGYYSVMLEDHGVKAEMTATERVGVHRYTFPQGRGHIILDLNYGIYNYDGKAIMSNLRVEDEYTLTGYRITRGWSRMNYTHFAIRFSKPIVNYGCRNLEKPKYVGWWRKFDMTDNFPEMFGTALTAYFDFDFEQGEALEIQVAISAVDALGAMKNLEAEGGSFDKILAQTSAKWNKELSVIEVKATEEQKAIFYTALYRTMINPSVYQDVDGRYRGIDHNIHQAHKGETNYTVFSVWDTFRAEHPLMNLVKRERSTQFVNSMLNHYSQSVHKALPVWSHMGNENWCMIGYHSVSVLADAYAKGIEFNSDLGLEACQNSANFNAYDQIGDYRKYGFVPDNKSSISASLTLEYSYDDWAIGAFANLKNNSEVANKYGNYAKNYRNIFDSRIGFARPSSESGGFREPFDPLDTHGQGFIEGNSWNYSFFVPHDVNGLMGRMGGERRFVERLDSLFTMELPAKYFENTEDINEEGLMGNYVHGNEPSHHVAYLYKWTSQPWKTELRVRAIMDKMYHNKPDGLCGNDDCGQMSAWFVLSSMGFYPVCPGSTQYVLGSPALPEAVINLEGGNVFTIKTINHSAKNVYIKSVTLNGKQYTKSYIDHADIAAGGVIVFEMAAKPNKNRSTDQTDRPYSLTAGGSEQINFNF